MIKTLRETIIDLGYMGGDDFDRLVQPDKMIRPQKKVDQAKFLSCFMKIPLRGFGGEL